MLSLGEEVDAFTTSVTGLPKSDVPSLEAQSDIHVEHVPKQESTEEDSAVGLCGPEPSKAIIPMLHAIPNRHSP